jgi:hypothetical protein
LRKKTPRRDIAKRRREKHAAVLRLVVHIAAKPTADAEVEISWIVVRVARCAKCLELVVGKQRRQAVPAGLVEMAAATIGFLRMVEQQPRSSAGVGRVLPSSQ